MWLLANKLTLNAKKPEFMLIGSRQRLSQIISHPILSIGSESIKRVSSTKTLGVMLDECITWKDHIDEVAKKAAKGIGILRRSKGFLDKDTLKTVYIALLFCHILTIVRWYGIIVPKLCKTNCKSFNSLSGNHNIRSAVSNFVTSN